MSPGDPISEILGLLSDASVEKRLEAAHRALALLDGASGLSTSRLEAGLFARLRVETQAPVRLAIARALFHPVSWALQYGSPNERKAAVGRVALLADAGGAQLTTGLTDALTAQLQREPQQDLKKALRTALIRIEAQRVGRRGGARSARLVAMGVILRNLRERAGLSRKALCEAAGLLKNSLGYMEVAAREEPLANYLKVFRVLEREVRPEDAARFYELWNRELAALAWYDGKRHTYSVRLPDGLTIREALRYSLPRFFRARQAELALRIRDLALRSGLSTRRIWDFANGRVRRPSVALLNRIATALMVDVSLLYLLSHREIPSFVRVIAPGVERDYRCLGARRFLCETPEEAPPRDIALAERHLVLARFRLSPRGHYWSGIARYLQYDPLKDELFIALPSEEARREAMRLDLRSRLRERLSARAESQHAFFRRSPICATAFRNVAEGRSIPSARHLRFLCEQLGISEECLLFWSLRQRFGDAIVARVGNAAGPVPSDAK